MGAYSCWIVSHSDSSVCHPEKFFSMLASCSDSQPAPTFPWMIPAGAEMQRHDDGMCGVVECSESLLKMLGEADLTYIMSIHSRQVGFDVYNRAVMTAEIPGLMTDIFEVGFSWRECAHAICAEEEPGSNTLEAHNKEVVKDSTILAPVAKPVEGNPSHASFRWALRHFGSNPYRKRGGYGESGTERTSTPYSIYVNGITIRRTGGT